MVYRFDFENRMGSDGAKLECLEFSAAGDLVTVAVLESHLRWPLASDAAVVISKKPEDF